MATKTVEILKSQLPLAELLQLTAAGDEVIIVEGSKPLARLVHIESTQQKRVAGLNSGAIFTSEDFDQPLPDELWTGTPDRTMVK